MKTRGIEVRKPIIGDKTANQINFICSRKDGGPVITETDLEFAKTSLILTLKKRGFRKINFKVLTAISCQLKALDRFN